MSASEWNTLPPIRPRVHRGGVEERRRRKIGDKFGNTIEIPSAAADKLTCWRAYFAGLVMASCLDAMPAQPWMSHASAKTTLDIYGHFWPDQDESSKAAVAAIFTERPGNTEQRRVCVEA